MLIKGSKYTPAPEGTHDAVCVDVVELYGVDTPWGPKDKVKVVWEIRQKMEDGRPYTASKRYTASIHEKSTFFKDLKGWFGRGPKGEFDTEGLIGKQCTLVIQHDERDGETYSNVVAILKKGGNALAASGKYVRQKDRADGRAAEADTQPDDSGWSPDEAAEEEAPF